MKIRDKLLYGFGLYILLAAILGFFAYKELRTIDMRLRLVETADDITNTILEVRRYEKNYLLYRDSDSFSELKQYLSTLKETIANIKTEIISEIGSAHYDGMSRAIGDYERLIDTIAASFGAQNEQAALVRNAGRKIELRLSGSDLQAFLVLRRYEKNVMLYRTGSVYEVFKKSFLDSGLTSREETQHYFMLVNRLFHLYDTERDAVGEMRKTAREIQSFTENLSKKERLQIGTTIKMSMQLLLIALVLILVVGTVVNIKLATGIATPIRKLEKISKKISEGDFSESIEVKGKDEIAALEIAFNQMEERLKNALWSLEHTIEKLREKQAQLVEAEKLASIGKLAAGIAHEINNPLTSVLTFSNLMLEQCPPSDPRHDKLKLMARETNRARNIVRQLLNFGRETAIRPEKINVNRPVSEITDSLAAQGSFQGIELTMNLADGLPPVSADPAQIGQVVMNMLLNAIHAITPPGRIEISTRMNGGGVEIVFSDSGAGIPEEHLHRIFDPFFTTKDASKGTGLGLAVSYGIIKKHGGEIDVASSVGRGTTFTVRLPVTA